jgi:hypothetical protein
MSGGSDCTRGGKIINLWQICSYGLICFLQADLFPSLLLNYKLFLATKKYVLLFLTYIEPGILDYIK